MLLRSDNLHKRIGTLARIWRSCGWRDETSATSSYHSFVWAHLKPTTALSRERPLSPCLRCKIRYRTLVRAKSSNFTGLVLGCIEADFCNQILFFQHFSRSTRFAILRTAQISKFQQKKSSQFCHFWITWINYSFKISWKTHEIWYFSSKSWWNFVGISRTFSENVKICGELQKILKKIAKTWSKSRNWWDYSFVRMNYSVDSLVVRSWRRIPPPRTRCGTRWRRACRPRGTQRASQMATQGVCHDPWEARRAEGARSLAGLHQVCVIERMLHFPYGLSGVAQLAAPTISNQPEQHQQASIVACATKLTSYSGQCKAIPSCLIPGPSTTTDC